MTNNLSCADYLSSLSEDELRCWVRLNISYNQFTKIWLAVYSHPVDSYMQSWSLGRSVIELCETHQRNKLITELAKEYINSYQVLPNKNQIEQIVADLINKTEEANLDSLDLCCFLLETLPDHLFKLSNLKNLYLAANLLTTIPNSISALTSLISLVLAKNNLSSISSKISNLLNLQYLDLSHNNLVTIPNEIGRLSNLKELSLSCNNLLSLPSEICNLSNLRLLNLYNNKLSKLPNDIRFFYNLQYLLLSSNQLAELPKEITELTKLKRLSLQGNEFLFIPPEILKFVHEPKKILNYYFQLLNEKQKQTLNEVKMLVVGEGKTGKTSLVNRLVDNIFNDPEPMTEGVIIKKHWPLKLSDEREIKVNIWDFGGQEIMHSTHQFFLTKRSLYLLVLDARHDEQQNRLDYWLKTIDNFADDAPIIIVCNQIDIKTLELDRKGLKSKYPNIKKFVEVSCKTREGIDLLKETISQEISPLKHIDDLLLSSWFKIKEQLEMLQNQQKDYLEYHEYQQMCEQENIDSLSEETLIGFLHDLGTVLCFHKDLRLRDTHILNPAWVTEGVYKILNYRGLAIDKGELTVSSLNQILNSNRYPRNKYIFIIEMMRKFELCFDLEGSKGEKLLIPDLLPKEAPELADLEHWNDSLKFEYHYELLPSSIISRFIVRMNAFIYEKNYWRYGVVLISEDKYNKALVKADLDANKIFIFVDGRVDSRKDLLSLIRADLRKIYNTIPKLQFEQKIPLSENLDILLDYEHLLELVEMGEEFIVPKGLRKKIAIKPLLEGIERKSTNEIERLHQALLKAYDVSSFKQMLRFKLGKDLDAITSANGFNNVVFDLIRTAQREGWLDSLVHCAKDHNSGNESLNNVANTFLNKH